MAELTRAGVLEAPIRELAVRLTSHLMQKDFEGEARACLAFVRDKIRYIRDPDGGELMHHPLVTLQIGAGDCEDKSILLASLLLTIGNPTRFVAVAFAPGVYAHVWVQAHLPPGYGHPEGRWIDLEATEPVPFGDSIPRRGVVSTIYENVI